MEMNYNMNELKWKNELVILCGLDLLNYFY